MLGDILKGRLNEVKKSIDSSRGQNAFCEVIKKIAIDEINALYPQKIDSNIIVETYYKILLDNMGYIPVPLKELSANGQYRFRISVRNVFTSNANHSNGLANSPYLNVKRIVNDNRKGRRYSYQGVEKYANKNK